MALELLSDSAESESALKAVAQQPRSGAAQYAADESGATWIEALALALALARRMRM